MSVQELGTPIAVGRTAEIFAWEDGHVLKLYRDWCPSNWVEHEAKIGKIVCAAGLPTPAIGDIVEVNQRRGILYERLDGTSMLVSFKAKLWTLPICARMLAELHAAMHACAVPSDLPSQREGFAKSIRHAPNLPTHLRDTVLRKLDQLPTGDRLCHGDFHPDNVMITARGPIIIDWMTATRGNPLADVARTLLLLTISKPQTIIEQLIIRFARRIFVSGYLKRYCELRPYDDDQLAAWQPIIAAARINENIAGERERLLALAGGGAKLKKTN